MRYTFLCDTEDGGCGTSFELSCLLEDYETTINRPQTCPNCRKRKSVHRDLQTDAPIHVGDSSPKTVGSVCDKNSSRMSEDQKIHLTKKHNEYKEAPPLRELPKGMSRTR